MAAKQGITRSYVNEYAVYRLPPSNWRGLKYVYKPIKSMVL